MFVRYALALTGVGVLIGLGGAMAVGRLAVPLILVTAAVLASILPAYRATAINPVDALKAE